MIEEDLYRGDTGPVIRPRPAVLDDGEVIDGNWSCFTAVLDEAGNIVIPKFEVTAKTQDGLRFMAVLNPENTSKLSVANPPDPTRYIWVVELSNNTTVPPFRIEKHYKLNVREQGVI